MPAAASTRKRENPMSIRSKNALGQSLLMLMMKKDFSDITIAEITTGAGLSRQTFYTNFERKEDILRYLLQGLFRRFGDKLPAICSTPETLIIEYFIYWDGNNSFLRLLFRQDLGAVFQECNRVFFMEGAGALDHSCHAENWQIPYIKASLAGLTYELLRVWITEQQGLSVDVLSSMARNLLSGKMFL